MTPEDQTGRELLAIDSVHEGGCAALLIALLLPLGLGVFLLIITK